MKNSMKTYKLFNNQRGITLVTLAITLIVMLILAMVTIRLAIQDDIIKESEEFTNKYEQTVNVSQQGLGGLYQEMTAGTSNFKDRPTPEPEPELEVGDWINYSAENWYPYETLQLKAGVKGSEAKVTDGEPTVAYQFGGIKANASRDENASGVDNSSIVKDTEGNTIAGWRVLDIESDGTLTLISAGAPEKYYWGSVSNYLERRIYFIWSTDSGWNIYQLY